MKQYILILGLSCLMLLSLSACATRVVTTSPNAVTVVKVAPKHHKVVVIRGKRYYYWNGRYHKKTRKGYVVVRVR